MMERGNFPLGNRGEEIACRYLRQMGYEVLERNFRCKIGEIDIVARDGKVTVFVEVKARKSKTYGKPKEAISFHKQKKLVQLAQYYMKKHHLFDTSARFDVIGIKWTENGRYNIELIQNAFDVES